MSRFTVVPAVNKRLVNNYGIRWEVLETDCAEPHCIALCFRHVDALRVCTALELAQHKVDQE